MIDRRTMMLGSACAALPLLAGRRAWAIPAVPDRIAFDVVRKGSTIGSHVVVFDRRGEELLVRIDVRMRVGLGPITLFRYHHQAIERWQGEQFVGIETTTDNNGEALRLSARRDGDTIAVEATNQRRAMPAAALPLTHWNIACMSAPLFNPQDGTPIDGGVTPGAMAKVPFADGRTVAARCFSMGGSAPLDDWYDDTQTWVHLRARAKDGSVVEYLRTA